MSKDHRDALLRSKRVRLDPLPEGILCTDREDWKQAIEKATSDLSSAIKQRTGSAHATRRFRILVSADQCHTDVTYLKDRLLPTLIKVLLLRQDGQDTAEAVLEAAWAITNLAAGQHDVVKTVLVSAPALIAHLSGWLGNPVADQCAWALGNMAGEDAAYCKILAANGAVLPLARLLLNTTCYNQGRAAESESAATTAAWALSNMLWGDPSQAGHLIEAPEFSKSLINVLQEEHDGGLHIEGAWLLAFLCGGSETHMHTMVKQGAADAAVRRLCSTLDKDGAFEDSLALLTPLLRCLGNMGTSKLAAKSLLSEDCSAAVRRCAECPNGSLRREARWVEAMLSKLAQG
ncbi:hypothetical protein WJX75_004856 [Coccomyxa subellipsoidea]|uniref:ARM repeat-containing protein n=1 Tax=Coccomyxa subellipsoidea TaxID=248742 RepID=A0ABR2YTC0_9CHLO